RVLELPGAAEFTREHQELRADAADPKLAAATRPGGAFVAAGTVHGVFRLYGDIVRIRAEHEEDVAGVGSGRIPHHDAAEAILRREGELGVAHPRGANGRGHHEVIALHDVEHLECGRAVEPQAAVFRFDV